MKYWFSRHMMAPNQRFYVNNIIVAGNCRSRNRKVKKHNVEGINKKLYRISAKQIVQGVNNKITTALQDKLDSLVNVINNAVDVQAHEYMYQLLEEIRNINNGSLRRYFLHRYSLKYSDLYE